MSVRAFCSKRFATVWTAYIHLWQSLAILDRMFGQRLPPRQARWRNGRCNTLSRRAMYHWWSDTHFLNGKQSSPRYACQMQVKYIPLSEKESPNITRSVNGTLMPRACGRWPTTPAHMGLVPNARATKMKTCIDRSKYARNCCSNNFKLLCRWKWWTENEVWAKWGNWNLVRTTPVVHYLVHPPRTDKTIGRHDYRCRAAAPSQWHHTIRSFNLLVVKYINCCFY